MSIPEIDGRLRDYLMEGPDDGLLSWGFGVIYICDSTGPMVEHYVAPDSVIEVLTRNGDLIHCKAETVRKLRGVWEMEGEGEYAIFYVTEKGPWDLEIENTKNGSTPVRIVENETYNVKEPNGHRSKRSGRDIQG